MKKSMGTSTKRLKPTRTPANPVAFSLKSGQFRQRIVKSKVKYNRKRSHKWCDNMSQHFRDFPY